MSGMKNLKMLRGGKFAETPRGPIVVLAKGEVHPFPLEMAEYLIEGGAAKVAVETPDFEGMSRAEIAKFTLDTFGVKVDARKAQAEVVKMAIAAFEAATKGTYQRPVAAAADPAKVEGEPEREVQTIGSDDVGSVEGVLGLKAEGPD